MNEKDKAELYQSLSQQLHTQYDQRRELEWKIHVAIWTLLSAIGALLITQKVHVGGNVFWLYLIVPFHFVWCVKSHTGSFRDQYLSRRYRLAAEDLVGKTIDSDADLKNLAFPPYWLRRTFRSYWWWIFAEVGTTLLLTAGITYIDWTITAPHGSSAGWFHF